MTNTQTRVLNDFVSAISTFAKVEYHVSECESNNDIAITIEAESPRNSVSSTICMGVRGGMYTTRFGGKTRIDKQELLSVFAAYLF